MSTTTLIRSPADCIKAVLVNLEFELRILAAAAAEYRKQVALWEARGDEPMRLIYVRFAEERERMAVQVRDHQDLIRTECAELLGVHASNPITGGAA